MHRRVKETLTVSLDLTDFGCPVLLTEPSDRNCYLSIGLFTLRPVLLRLRDLVLPVTCRDFVWLLVVDFEFYVCVLGWFFHDSLYGVPSLESVSCCHIFRISRVCVLNQGEPFVLAPIR